MALIDWVSNTWQKVKSLPKKIAQVTKNTYQTLKAKAPTPKRIGSALWKITVDGSVRGFNYGTLLTKLLRLPSEALDFVQLTPFVISSVLIELGKGSQNAVLKLLRMLGREFQEGLALAAPIGTLCLLFGPTDPNVLIGIFCLATGLSISKQVLYHVVKKILSLSDTKSEAQPSRIKSLLKSLAFLTYDVILPIAEKAGQGALAKKLFDYFALALYQQNVNVNSSLAFYESFWTNLFVIGPPVLEASFNLSKKISAYYSWGREKVLEVLRLANSAFWYGVTIWTYSVLLISAAIQNNRADDEISPLEYIICFATLTPIGAVASYRFYIVARNKKEAAALLASQHEQKDIELNTISIDMAHVAENDQQKTPNHTISNSHAVIMIELDRTPTGVNSDEMIFPEEILQPNIDNESDIESSLLSKSNNSNDSSRASSPRGYHSGKNSPNSSRHDSPTHADNMLSTHYGIFRESPRHQSPVMQSSPTSTDSGSTSHRSSPTMPRVFELTDEDLLLASPGAGGT